MLNETSGIWKIALSILFFPLFFQDGFLRFAWGTGEPHWLIFLKRLFLLLPAGAIVLGCWVTGISLLTVIVRQRRTEFATALLLTWWDLGKSIGLFWGGIFRFIAQLFISAFAFSRLIALAVLLFIGDLILFPFQLARRAAENAFGSGIPWIAVILTLGWTLLEATIFTFVTSPLVVDTLSNMIGQQLSERFIRAPLFLFMFFIVLGSYSVLLTLTDAIKSRNVPSIVKIALVESVAIFVEVVFLYREFVDALVPWFAQHSSGFELGVTGTLAIATFTWLGVRSLSWFLFAAHGTPLIMAVIQGRGFHSAEKGKITAVKEQPVFKLRTLKQIRDEFEWLQACGDDLVGAFILPPLQIVAAGLNFCTLLMTAQHLFELPLIDYRAVLKLKPKLKDVHEALKKTA